MEIIRKPTVSLVIPAYNEEKYIGECLRYAIENGKGKFLEMIVVDNGSTDRTAEIARSFAGVKVVREEEKGTQHARQKGYLEAKGDILAYIDADTRMPSGWYEKIVEAFSKDAHLACLSGPYIYHDISPIRRFLVACYFRAAIVVYWFLGYMAIIGNMAIRRDVVRKMGGLDTRILFYGDDTDTARRAKAFGKVAFRLGFIMYTSARRLNNEGTLYTAYRYMLNFFSEVTLKRPAKKHAYTKHSD